MVGEIEHHEKEQEAQLKNEEQREATSGAMMQLMYTVLDKLKKVRRWLLVKRADLLERLLC